MSHAGEYSHLLSLDDYALLLANKTCYCGKPLSGLEIKHEDHVGGWRVAGFEKRQWLSVHCEPCKYGLSLWKVGVPGKATFEEQLLEEILVYGKVHTFTGFAQGELAQAYEDNIKKTSLYDFARHGYRIAFEERSKAA